MTILSIIKSGLYLFKLAFDLAVIWLTLDWKVRKAKKAFQKELVGAGLPIETAKKLADKYSSVKDEVMKQLWGSVLNLRRLNKHHTILRLE